MNRLAAELSRLYQFPPTGEAGSGQEASDGVRLLWISLRGADAWPQLRTLGQRVQAELDWPAPAIAVSGQDAFELWFSLAEPVDAEQAQPVLHQLCQRYLDAPVQSRLSLWPGGSTPPELPGLPRQIEGETRWSAFVAPDLAPIFADTPWLDIPPSEEGQAELLSVLRSVSAQQWQRAGDLLRPSEASVQPQPPRSVAPAALWTERGAADPRQFLQQVMQDPQVALALRIEAAKALLMS